MVKDLVDFIHNYSNKSGETVIMSQITESMRSEDPSSLFEFVIDHRYVDKQIKEYILSLGDFNEFSRKFSEDLKSVVFKLDRNLHEKIEDVNIIVRFKNFLYDSDKNQYPNLITIRSLNSAMMDKYLCFRGIIRNIVIQQSNIRKQKFRCRSCGNIMTLDFNDLDDRFDVKQCTNGDCKSDELVMIKTMGGTTDIEILTIEELANDSEKDTDSVTVTVDGDLVNKFSLGDTVIVTGNFRLDVFSDTDVNQFKKK